MEHLTPLDWIILHAEEVKQRLGSRGLTNARVTGWAGAGKALPGPVEIAADLPPETDLTAGDVARLDRELETLLGFEVVVVAEQPGSRRVLPGERIRYL